MHGASSGSAERVAGVACQPGRVQSAAFGNTKTGGLAAHRTCQRKRGSAQSAMLKSPGRASVAEPGMKGLFASSSTSMRPGQLSAALPNPSFNPRRATAAGVSPVRARRSIVAYRAYTACLRTRG